MASSRILCLNSATKHEPCLMFEPGQEVICVKPSLELEEGRIYRVRRVYKSRYTSNIFVSIVGCGGGTDFYVERFAAVNPMDREFLAYLLAKEEIAAARQENAD